MRKEYWKYQKTTEEKKSEYWEAKEKKLEELIEQKKEIAKQIHLLKVELNNHKNYMPKGIRTDTEVYKMFGKPLNELTKEEYRIYYNARQKINRQKRKNKGGK